MGVALMHGGLYVGAFAAVVILLASLFVRVFARSLPYSRGLLISVIAVGLSTLPLAVYYWAKSALGIPQAADTVAVIVWMSLAGTLISKQARQHGVEKTGFLGLGAKVMFCIIALTWIATAIGYFIYR